MSKGAHPSVVWEQALEGRAPDTCYHRLDHENKMLSRRSQLLQDPSLWRSLESSDPAESRTGYWGLGRGQGVSVSWEQRFSLGR